VVDTAGPLLVNPGDRVMLCSDGLWGVLPDATITEILAQHAISDAVPELVERALRVAGERSDNVTVLAVEWEAAEDLDSKSGISTRSLGEEVFASTIQASLGADGSGDELDEAEIERSIREINEAIQRSSSKRR
jgi:PPM family protein phosphatase